MVFVSGLLAATGIFCLVGAFIYQQKGHEIGPSYIIGAGLTLMGIISIVLNYIFDEKMLLRFWALIFAIAFLSVPVSTVWGIIRHEEKWNKSLVAPLLLGIFCLVGVFVI